MKRAERRRHKRIRRNLIVRFRIRSRDALRNVNSEEWPMGIIENLSAEGALFVYNRTLDIGSLIEFKVKFPISRTALNCVGKVIRVQEIPDSAIYRVAVTFIEMEKDAKEKIDKFSEDFNKKLPV